MPSDHEHADDRVVLSDLIRKLVDSGRSFSITLDDTADLDGQSGGARTRHLLTLTGNGECKKWVYVPGTGPVCVDPPS